MSLFNTATEYQTELKRIQNKQIELMETQNMRLKVNRLKKEELTAQFFAIKKDWKENTNIASSVEEEAINKESDEQVQPKTTKNKSIPYISDIKGKLVVELAENLSDTEIERVFKNCVCDTLMINFCKNYRDRGLINNSNIQKLVKIHKATF
tara:strand:+ start:51 stop:506 length:456 start_codon:yes stop_codon:yes gene_type:complete